jgi:hypothetical protein
VARRKHQWRRLFAEGQTRIVTKSDFCAVAHGFGTSDVAVNRNRPPIIRRVMSPAEIKTETSVVKRGRKLVFKSVGRVLAAKDVTAGAHHVRGAVELQLVMVQEFSVEASSSVVTGRVCQSWS